MKFLKLIFLSMIIVFLLSNVIFPFDRVILLSPASADIFKKLHLEKKIVGVTKHIHGFKNAKKIGTHIKPNLELMKSLNPDLVVLSSSKFFNDTMKQYVKAKIYYYNPVTLNGIINHIKRLGNMFNKEEEAQKLVKKLKNKLKKITKLSYSPNVIYEIMAIPYILAGKKNIINDIILKAGGKNLININKKLVRFSYEKVLFLKPDIYIYQVGPMNKNPIPPNNRKYFKRLNSFFVRVDEKKFARANTHSFDNVLFLNKIFLQFFQMGGIKK